MTSSPLTRLSLWIKLGLFILILGGFLTLRLPLFLDTSFSDQVLMLSGLFGAFIVLAFVFSLRWDYICIVIYAYLATFYFANRAFFEVWLGPPSEAGAGTVAPFLFGDVFLLFLVFRKKTTFHFSYFFFLFAILNIAMLGLFSTEAHVGSAIYQTSSLIRSVTIIYVIYSYRDLFQAKHLIYLTHIVAVMSAMGLVAFLAYFVLGVRASVPGWGANVLANGLCLTGILSLWLFSRVRVHRWFYLLTLSFSLLGIVGSNTRLALIVLAGIIALRVVFAIVPGRSYYFRLMISLLVLAVVSFSQSLIILETISEINPRIARFTNSIQQQGLSLESVYNTLSEDNSIIYRFMLFSASYEMFAENPLLGIGWGQWNWRKGEFGAPFKVLLDSHNGYLWSLAEGGLLGFLLIYGGVTYVLVRCKSPMLRLVILVAMFLELTNANIQKPLYGVLFAFILGIALILTPANLAKQRAYLARSLRHHKPME